MTISWWLPYKPVQKFSLIHLIVIIMIFQSGLNCWIGLTSLKPIHFLPRTYDYSRFLVNAVIIFKKKSALVREARLGRNYNLEDQNAVEIHTNTDIHTVTTVKRHHRLWPNEKPYVLLCWLSCVIMKIWEQPWSQDEITSTETMNMHDEYIIGDTKPADFSR